MATTSPLPAPVVAASQSSVNTVLSTIEQGTEILQKILPEAAAVGGFVPGATVYIQLAGLALPQIQNAIKWIEQEYGKTPFEAFEDLIKTITPNNGYVSPALSSSPTSTATGD